MFALHVRSAGAPHPEPPRFANISAHGDRLSDVSFWSPYINAVLSRHDLNGGAIESGFVGTFPTFLANDVVVKLFGYFPAWQRCHDVELAALRVVTGRPDISVPALRANGRLYDSSDEPWPYLVSERLTGVAWRDANLDDVARTELAAELGRILRLVHDLPQPFEFADEDWPAAHRGDAAERHRRWGSLPEHLIAQTTDP